MYTYLYWFLDKHYRIMGHGRFEARDPYEAEWVFVKKLMSDRHFRKRLREAFMIKKCCLLTSVLKANTHVQSATDLFLVACCQWELTCAEMNVMLLLNEQKTNKEIAGILCISLNTVKTHVGYILSKMEVKTRTQAVAKAQEKARTFLFPENGEG